MPVTNPAAGADIGSVEAGVEDAMLTWRILGVARLWNIVLTLTGPVESPVPSGPLGGGL